MVGSVVSSVVGCAHPLGALTGRYCEGVGCAKDEGLARPEESLSWARPSLPNLTKRSCRLCELGGVGRVCFLPSVSMVAHKSHKGEGSFPVGPVDVPNGPS